jgi:hypothetical protein
MDRAADFCASKGRRMQLADEEQEKTRMDIDTTIIVTFTCVAG